MKTMIFGHKNPDSDAVLSAISLSYLENKCGNNTEPRVLGNINKETKYALDYFGLEEPDYLNDVKLQIKDVDYHKGFFMREDDSIYEGYQYMLSQGLTGLPVVKDNNIFSGLITMKDLSKNILDEETNKIETSYQNILDVLRGEEVLKFDEEIKGEVLAAAYQKETFLNTINLDKNHILIVGNRQDIIKYAINSNIGLLIITGNGNVDSLEEAKKNKINIIRTELDTYHVARLIQLTNYIKTMNANYNPTKFLDTDFVDDVNDINNKLKHTNYPVVDKNNKCLGLLRITDLSEKHPKQVILVDHSEKKQSVEGLDEALIKEIIDHHNLGGITTGSPINYRNMVVGSTCTIVYTMFVEREIEIPKNIAGALLSGLLSDTLILKSPTTTERDRQAAPVLAKLAGVDYEKYGMEMLKAGTSLEGMSKEDVLYNDFKLYTVGDYTFGIGQFFTMNFEEIEKDMDEYIKVIDQVSEANNYDFLALYVTDIIENGSYLLFNTRGKDKVEVMYPELETKEGMFIEKCVSRKKNVIPLVMEVYEN